jgi:hypothetical protein
MSELCEIIQNNSPLLPDTIGPVRISSDKACSCTIRSPVAIIKLFVDERDRSVSSTLLPLKAPNEYQEEYPAHVIAEFFNKTNFVTHNESTTLVENVVSEMKCLAEIASCLASSDERELRDLYHFFAGYSRSYTDNYL